MKDRKADFLTAENCNREVDRLREQISRWKDVVASRDAEVAELNEFRRGEMDRSAERNKKLREQVTLLRNVLDDKQWEEDGNEHAHKKRVREALADTDSPK